jgi:hypothetical protein
LVLKEESRLDFCFAGVLMFWDGTMRSEVPVCELSFLVIDWLKFEASSGIGALWSAYSTWIVCLSIVLFFFAESGWTDDAAPLREDGAP